MANRKCEKDEHLEQLWYMKEDGKDSLDALKEALGKDYNEDIINELSSERLVELDVNSAKITITNSGEGQARQLIRAHRLAERLLYDVMGGDFETGACEFEHIITPKLVDSICILLGHPRECPHGMPIPQGECCKASTKTVQSSVIPVTELKIGQSARVAYVNCESDRQLHKMDGLLIRPGSVVKLHQVYPTYVIECEGANIALDSDLISNICVWKELARPEATEGHTALKEGQDTGVKGRGSRFRFRKGKKHE